MATVSYRVEPHDFQWSILCDGQAGTEDVSQEAAFEVAVSAASGELRKGNEVRIEWSASPMIELETVEVRARRCPASLKPVLSASERNSASIITRDPSSASWASRVRLCAARFAGAASVPGSS